MVINKTILRVIFLSNRSCPYEFNASIDFWLKPTSHVDVIVPSTVSTTQNAKLLPSPNLGHSLMLCQVTRSQGMGSMKHFGDPPVLEPSRLRRNRRSCRKWITRAWGTYRFSLNANPIYTISVSTRLHAISCCMTTIRGDSTVTLTKLPDCCRRSCHLKRSEILNLSSYHQSKSLEPFHIP